MDQTTPIVRLPLVNLPTWLAHAKELLSVHEIPGTKHHPLIIQWLHDVGLRGEMLADETPWCAACANGVLKQAGVQGTGSAAARSFLNWGTALVTPRLGCAAIYARPPDPASGHVAFWIADFGMDDLVWGGNQGNCCCFALRPRSLNLGYRWPTGVPA